MYYTQRESVSLQMSLQMSQGLIILGTEGPLFYQIITGSAYFQSYLEAFAMQSQGHVYHDIVCFTIWLSTILKSKMHGPLQ